ncbi:MAG: hypothetical protein L0154_00655 [Chloroflexi bacterium]|nr:hypothetical protein [Chloroflexota bacterium]
MENEEVQETINRWRTRIEELGVGGIVDTLLLAFAPFAPIGAQLLYIAQPVMGLFVERNVISRWARLLEEPDGLEWLRVQLTGHTDE